MAIASPAAAVIAPEHQESSASQVLREDLGRLIVSFLPLSEIALVACRVDWSLHAAAREHIASVWPRLEPLLEAPFCLSPLDILLGEDFDLYDKGLSHKDVETLFSAIAIGALASCRRLYLEQNQIGDAGIEALAKAAACGALPKLVDLRLYGNQIGDIGMEALAQAAATGAMANCQTLDLQLNQIGDSGVEAFAKAVADGAMAGLRNLNLQRNQIGDAGMISLSKALGKGALPKLGLLALEGNQISDAGLEALSGALATGALPALEEQTLCLDGNPASWAAQQTARVTIRNRKYALRKAGERKYQIDLLRQRMKQMK